MLGLFKQLICFSKSHCDFPAFLLGLSGRNFAFLFPSVSLRSFIAPCVAQGGNHPVFSCFPAACLIWPFFFFGPQYTDLDKGKREEVVFPRVPASLALKRQSKKGSERLMAQRQLGVSAVPSLSALLVLRAMPGV